MTRTVQHIKSGRINKVIGDLQHTSKYYKKTITLGGGLTINTIKYNNGRKDYLDYLL